MDTYDEHDEMTCDDEPGLMSARATYRNQARANLDQIAKDTKQAIADAGIEMDVFFIIPNNGDSLLTFGTPGDPSDDLWDTVSEIVSAVVRQSIGLDHATCRSLLCATTQ